MKFVALLLFSFITVAAEASPVIPPPPVLDARFYALYDLNSKQLLVNKRANERTDPGGLTKLMTIYLVFEALKRSRLGLDQDLPVPDAVLAKQQEDSRMFLKPGQNVAVNELLNGLIIASANDAAITLAIGAAGSQEDFIAWMNKTAQRLGLKNTHFTNLTGKRDDDHYSSAHDLALLSAALVDEFPQYYERFAERDLVINNTTIMNHNRLLWLDPFAEGLFSASGRAGFHQAGLIRRGEHRLVALVLGAPAQGIQASEAQELLNYGFRHFDLVKLYNKGQTVAKARVWRGVENETRMGFREDLYVTIPKGRANLLQASVETPKPVFAPIEQGQWLGTLKLSFNGKPYAAFPMVSLDENSQANVFARGWDGIRLLFE